MVETPEVLRHADLIESRGRSGECELYLIPSLFDTRVESMSLAILFLERLAGYFTERFACHHEAFLQTISLRRKDSAGLFSDHAAQWIPEMGLGMWPHRDPPRMWRAEDFKEMDPHSGLRNPLDSLFRVTARAPAPLDALRTMTGHGCGVHLFSTLESGPLLDRFKDLFLPTIEDRVYRIFPWYVPLLELAALHHPPSVLVSTALRSLDLYIRESVEDKGVLVVSREPLGEAFATLGCGLISRDGAAAKWRLLA